MQNLVIEHWCLERAKLIAGLLETLEQRNAQLPPNADTGDYHIRATRARKEAAGYIDRLQSNQWEEYNSYPHDVSALEVGLLLVPSLPRYHSLPWKSEQLPTVLHMLAIEAEALATICKAQNSIAESTWLLNQVRAEFKKIDP